MSYTAYQYLGERYISNFIVNDIKASCNILLIQAYKKSEKMTLYKMIKIYNDCKEMNKRFFTIIVEYLINELFKTEKSFQSITKKILNQTATINIDCSYFWIFWNYVTSKHACRCVKLDKNNKQHWR